MLNNQFTFLTESLLDLRGIVIDFKCYVFLFVWKSLFTKFIWKKKGYPWQLNLLLIYFATLFSASISAYNFGKFSNADDQLVSLNTLINFSDKIFVCFLLLFSKFDSKWLPFFIKQNEIYMHKTLTSYLFSPFKQKEILTYLQINKLPANRRMVIIQI